MKIINGVEVKKQEEFLRLIFDSGGGKLEFLAKIFTLTISIYCFVLYEFFYPDRRKPIPKTRILY